MPKEVIGTYDPRIPPSRELEREFQAQVDSQRGTYRTVRKGEMFICSCTCMALFITSLIGKAYDFTDRHKECQTTQTS
jgi:hypothetical protein